MLHGPLSDSSLGGFIIYDRRKVMDFRNLVQRGLGGMGRASSRACFLALAARACLAQNTDHFVQQQLGGGYDHACVKYMSFCSFMGVSCGIWPSCANLTKALAIAYAE